jgi:uncharacterized protein YcnI
MRYRLRKFTAMFGSFMVCMLLFAGVASAHVTVRPQTSTVGAWEMYTMRVPTEKTNPTEKIVLRIPAGVIFEQYEAVPGWSVTEQKGSNGSVSMVTWTATAGGIAPGQFQEFSFVAQNPKTVENVAWNAYQYYQDKSIVEWTGGNGSQTPHSITEMMASTASSTSSSPTAQNTSAAQNASSAATTMNMPANSNTGGNSLWVLVLSILAIILSVCAILLAVRLKRS